MGTPTTAGRRLRNTAWFMLGALFTTAIGIFGTALYEDKARNIVDRIAWVMDGTPAITCNSIPKWYRKIAPKSIAANTVYQDNNDTSYVAANAADGNADTAWIGNYDAPNAKYMSWIFDRETNIRLICITNGYTRTGANYSMNGRVQLATLTGCGNEDIHFTMPDHWDPEKKDPGDYREYVEKAVDCTPGYMRLWINKIYPAVDAKKTVAIADVTFYGP
ncbi:NADase-type glycan-binding domain-containing protein [Nonomuraea sp. NPDC047897]|uniref:NADase-type glycan-binding domain-containing protein n=1 Tax=Nonomuraea sp. NPDC047897 TaxID=3364346 RepID=UPI00372111F7